MELVVLAGGVWYLNKTLRKPGEDVDYIRNAETPMCPKCYYNVTRQNLPDAGNSQAFESTWFEPKSVPQIRTEITKSIYHGTRNLLANGPFNTGIITRQIQVKGDNLTQIGRIPNLASPWLAESIAKSYVPKVLSFWPEKTVPKSK